MFFRRCAVCTLLRPAAGFSLSENQLITDCRQLTLMPHVVKAASQSTINRRVFVSLVHISFYARRRLIGYLSTIAVNRITSVAAAVNCSVPSVRVDSDVTKADRSRRLPVESSRVVS